MTIRWALTSTVTNTVALLYLPKRGRWIELPDGQREGSTTFKNGRDAADWLVE